MATRKNSTNTENLNEVDRLEEASGLAPSKIEDVGPMEYEKVPPSKVVESTDSVHLASGDFGAALEALKKGHRVARRGWNGKGMFLKYQEGYPINEFQQPVFATDNPEEDNKRIKGSMLPFILMKVAGNSAYWGSGYSDYVPWLASQTDILAQDWEIVSF